MKSIKPGRGPSMMGGFMGIVVALFGVFWTIIAVSMGAGLMGIFGIIFVVVAIVQAVYRTPPEKIVIRSMILWRGMKRQILLTSVLVPRPAATFGDRPLV